LSEPIRAPIAPVQSQSTALQKGREDSFIPLLNNNDDDFNNLGGDEDRLSKDEEIPRDKAPSSSYPYNQVSAIGEQSASNTESNIETSTTRKGKEKALPAI
jgi:hypothetical protein